MNKMFKLLAGVSYFVVTVIANSANAGPIKTVDWDTLGAPTGNTATVDGLAVVSGQGGDFVSKSRVDLSGTRWTGFGLTGRPPGEISLGQSISIDFFSPQVVSNFKLAYLWPNTTLLDAIDETAVISVHYFDGSVFDYYLKALSADTASWSGLGTVVNLSPADKFPNTAVWSVTNPFSNALVSKLVFAPLRLDDGTSLRDSDFSVVSVSVVSEPNSFILFVSLLIGVCMLRSMLLRR